MRFLRPGYMRRKIGNDTKNEAFSSVELLEPNLVVFIAFLPLQVFEVTVDIWQSAKIHLSV